MKKLTKSLARFALFSALRAGLHDFICHHAPIFTSYREVGQAFPAHYL
jgi:hypothetical protein